MKLKFERDIKSLADSSKVLESTCKNLHDESLETALASVFEQFKQVRVTLSTQPNPSSFLCRPASLSKLNLRYLEITAPRNPDAGRDVQAFHYGDQVMHVKEALAALNTVATQKKDSDLRLGLELNALSSCSHPTLLDEASRFLGRALCADKLLVYLKVHGLRQSPQDYFGSLHTFLENLENHPALQRLVLGDTCINESAATLIVELIDTLSTLNCVDLSACSVSPEARQVLGKVTSGKLVLPSQIGQS